MRSWIAGTKVSNTVEGTDVRILCLLCVVQVTASATNWRFVQKCPTGCV